MIAHRVSNRQAQRTLRAQQSKKPASTESDSPCIASWTWPLRARTWAPRSAFIYLYMPAGVYGSTRRADSVLGLSDEIRGSSRYRQAGAVDQPRLAAGLRLANR